MKNLMLFIFLYIVFSVTNLHLHGQIPENKAYSMAPLFTDNDSIILTSTETEELIYQHVLKKRQTLYSLSNFFGLDVFSLYDLNPRLNFEIAKVGDTISVPIKSTDIIQTREPYKEYYRVFYKVKKKDTRFAVRHRIFHIDKNSFLMRNPSSIDGLKVNELLFIGYLPISGVRKDSVKVDKTLFSYVQESMEARFKTYNIERIKESKGMAYWNPQYDDQSGFFVLFNDAPANSYVEIVNPMYNRRAYARVISYIPPNMYQNNVMIVVSPMLANYLGVMDSRFFINLRYLQQQE